MMIIGIDPGQNGAATLLDDKRVVDSFRFKDMTERDISEWFKWATEKTEKAYIEKIHTMPAVLRNKKGKIIKILQGGASSGKFMQSYGFIRGCLISLNIPFEEVTPQKWQNKLECMSHGNKNITKSKAQQLFPETKITHANADSLLIAEYGRRVTNEQA